MKKNAANTDYATAFIFFAKKKTCWTHLNFVKKNGKNNLNILNIYRSCMYVVWNLSNLWPTGLHSWKQDTTTVNFGEFWQQHLLDTWNQYFLALPCHFVISCQHSLGQIINSTLEVFGLHRLDSSQQNGFWSWKGASTDSQRLLVWAWENDVLLLQST